MSELSHDQRARDSFVEVQKRRQGLLPDTPKPEPKKPEKPKGFKAKWENYWYHYKAVTIIAIAAVLIVGFATYDMLTRTHYDLTVILASRAPNLFSREDEDYIIKQLKPLTPDLTGNGKVDICIANIYNPGSDVTASQQLVAMLNSGESALIITDDETFDKYFKGQGGLVNLEERYGSHPQLTEPYRYALKGSALTANTNQTDSLNTLAFSVRDLSEFPGKSKTQGKAAYQAALKVMDQLIKQKAEA